MKHYKYNFIALIALVIVGTPWIMSAYPQSMQIVDRVFKYAGDAYATVFLHKTITVAELQNKYNAVPVGQPKIRIFVMPGHEPNYGGAEYKKLKERDMTVELAKDLEGFLEGNSHYEVMVGRDEKAWNPDLQNYFDQHWNDIIAFFNESKAETVRLINTGTLTKATDTVFHNAAPRDVALRLYGINKWVNENKVDMAIHIHFNDYPRNNASTPGKYSGLAIYVPEKQYVNSTTTRAIADAVFKRLTKYTAVSDMPKEDAGVVEEQELIAIGEYNTLEVPSMLIEYSYIYEPQLSDPETRTATLKDMAFQTYLGIQDFFGSGNDVSLVYDTLILPYTWTTNISKKNFTTKDVLALQSALIFEGLYPPAKGTDSDTKNDCPRTGAFGPCTIEALSNFQKKYGITGEQGIVGEKTRKVLNERYSAQIK